MSQRAQLRMTSMLLAEKGRDIMNHIRMVVAIVIVMWGSCLLSALAYEVVTISDGGAVQ